MFNFSFSLGHSCRALGVGTLFVLIMNKDLVYFLFFYFLFCNYITPHSPPGMAGELKSTLDSSYIVAAGHTLLEREQLAGESIGTKIERQGHTT